MVRFSHSIEQRKQIYSCEANSLGVVWYSYNKQINRLCVYRCLLTNHLHGKAAELCLANSIATTNTSNTLIASGMCPWHALLFLSRGVGKVCW